MVRGVNKRIIEITNTGHDCFERVFVVLKENLGDRTEAELMNQADGYVRELAKGHRQKLAGKPPHFAGFAVAPQKNSGMGTKVQTTKRKRMVRFLRKVLPWALLAVALLMAVVYFSM